MSAMILPVRQSTIARLRLGYHGNQGEMTPEAMHLPVRSDGSLVDFSSIFQIQKMNDNKFPLRIVGHTQKGVFMCQEE